MADNNLGEIGQLNERVSKTSDKALYPYLNIHILSSYTGDCFAYAYELKRLLQEEGFESTAMAADIEEYPPEDSTKPEEYEFWHDKSKMFLEGADVAIFLFLDHIFERPELSQKARGQSKQINHEPKEINSSVSAELEYWVNEFDENGNRTLAIFEGDMFHEMGSVVSGIPESKDIEYYKVEKRSIEETVTHAKKVSMNWAMNDLRPILRERYNKDHYY